MIAVIGGRAILETAWLCHLYCILCVNERQQYTVHRISRIKMGRCADLSAVLQRRHKITIDTTRTYLLSNVPGIGLRRGREFGQYIIVSEIALRKGLHHLFDVHP